MSDQDTAPCVGIFWIYQGEIFGAAVRHREGVTTSLGIIDTDVDHASFWERDRAHHVRFPELIDVEYFDVPRGRVLFDIASQLSIVYLDVNLNSSTVRETISRFFALDQTRARWRVDAHYVTH